MKTDLAVKAFAHPLRPLILGLLADGERRSPKELSDELEQPLGNVSYHVRTLAAMKLIKPAGKVPRRGAVEHYYRLDPDRGAQLADQLDCVAGAMRKAVNGDAR